METICLLSIVVSPAIEDTIVDWLLDREEIPGFTSTPIYGHGSSIHSLSTQEQVTGRKKQVLFQVHMPSADAGTVIETLKQEFQGSGMHYWILPVSDAGHLE